MSLDTFLCLPRWVAKVASGLFYCWSLLRNDIVATNLQKFALYCGSSRDAALTKKDVGTHTKKLVILKQLRTHFKAKHEKSVGMPFPRVPAPLQPG